MEWSESEEVRAANADGKPLVALETSVVVQGLPYPENVKAAQSCEAAVRESGAVPAALAVVEGRIHVGVGPQLLERLARGDASFMKLGARDLSYAVAMKRTGGTTVSATCALAARAGIRIFSTGGIGGVHRGVTETADVSNDLMAMAEAPVAVVCAGAKSILDLPRTLELLETLGVPVVGVGTDTLPSFYSCSSSLRLEQQVEDAEQASALLRARFESLKQGGVVFTLPPPEATAIPEAEIEQHVSRALEEAQRQNVRGKALTPFLLGFVARSTSGRSLQANLALLANNARFAGKLAVAYAQR